MRKLFVSIVLGSSLLAVGCESNNQQPGAGAQNQGYAGGNGEFGENPVQPGEHSQQRFSQDRDVPSGNLQGGQEVH